MDPLELLKLTEEQAEKLKKRAENEEVSSEEVVGLLFEADQTALESYPELRCGVVIQCSIDGPSSRSSFFIDLKSSPVGIYRANENASESTNNSRSPFPPDISVTVASEDVFRGLLSKRLDFMQAYNSSQISVEGSLRSKLKLKPLMELGERLRKERTEQEFAAIDIADTEGLSGKKEGWLRKKSEWLRQWNKRYIRLEWDEYHRPVLAYSVVKGEAPKSVVELHSSFRVDPRPTTQFAFNLVDLRDGSNSFILAASSHEEYLDWIKAFKSAVSARSRASQLRASSPLHSGHQQKGKNFAFPATGDVVGRDGQAGGESGEASIEVQKKQRVDLANAKAALVASTIESHFSFVVRRLNWRILPIGFTTYMIFERVASGASWLFGKCIDLLPGELPKEYPQATEKVVVFTVLLTLSMLCRWIYWSDRFELFRRRWTVYLISFKLILDLKLTKMKSDGLPAIHANALWNTKQVTIAETIYRNSLALGGLWVKAAQHVGARPDSMPAPVVNVLSRLQDQVPPTEFKHIKPMIEQELGCPIQDKFRSFEETPIAAASIGQVHRAVLKDGHDCVVKIQHPGVREKVLQDIDNMGIILSWLTIIDSSFDLKPIFDAWRKDVVNELDFTKELSYMIKVGDNLKQDPRVHATVPTGYELMSTPRMMLMRFVTGAKLTDADAMQRVGVYGPEARSQLAEDICNAFAYQMFISGLFNADPHPGNILVVDPKDVRGGQVVHVPEKTHPLPVILDFGLSGSIPDHVRLAFCRLVYAGCNVDISGLLTTGDELGITVLKEDFMEILSAMEFFFRDTAPPEESIEVVRERMEMEKTKFYEGEHGKKPPIDISTLPPEFILFFRSLDLLRGLCSSLEVRHPFIDTLALWAKRGLLDHAEKESGSSQQSAVDTSSVRAGPLEAEIREQLSSFAKENAAADGDAYGVQVTVLENSQVTAQVCAGVLSDLDLRPVDNDTLFSALSIAQAVSQMTVLSYLVSETVQTMQSKVSTISNGKASEKSPTLEDILCGDLRRFPSNPAALPPGASSKNLRSAYWAENMKFVEEEMSQRREVTESKQVPWEFAHVSFLWGWALGWIADTCFNMRRAKDKSSTDKDTVPALSRLVQSKICEPLALGHEIVFGLEEDGIVKRKVAKNFVPVRQLLKENGIENLNSLLNAEEMKRIVGDTGNGGGSPMDFVAESMPSLKGREFWADPRIYSNYTPMLQTCLPATNVLCTSRALARMFDTVLVRDGKHNEKQAISSRVGKLLKGYAADGDDPFDSNRLGLKRFRFQHETGEIEAFGSFSLGGSVVFSIPKLNVSVAVLTNCLTLNRDLTQKILDVIYANYGLVPLGDY